MRAFRHTMNVVPGLTPWYPAEVLPVRVGVYEVKAWSYHWYSHWNGTRWGFCERTPREAHKYRAGRTDRQIIQWRGLSRA